MAKEFPTIAMPDLGSTVTVTALTQIILQLNQILARLDERIALLERR